MSALGFILMFGVVAAFLVVGLVIGAGLAAMLNEDHHEGTHEFAP